MHCTSPTKDTDYMVEKISHNLDKQSQKNTSRLLYIQLGTCGKSVVEEFSTTRNYL
jgi:G:T-mismatch repair DNA endonuclease (very short patch repair protein)